MEPTVTDLPDTEYFALPSLDQSQLKRFRHNPAEWAWERLNPSDTEPTPAMRFGTAFHAHLLGTATVTSLPEGETFAKKDNKAWRCQQEREGNIPVTFADKTLLDRMRDNILQYADYAKMIGDGRKETCIQWEDTDTGLTLKAKPDLVPDGDTPYLVDLKTAQTADPARFPVHAVDFGYHIQAEFYRAAVAIAGPEPFHRTTDIPDAMMFWVFEKTGRCDWMPYRLGAESPLATAARATIRNTLRRIAECVEEGEAHGLGSGLDAAARWCLDRGWGTDPSDPAPLPPKRVEEMEVPDWRLAMLEAEY